MQRTSRLISAKDNHEMLKTNMNSMNKNINQCHKQLTTII